MKKTLIALTLLTVLPFAAHAASDKDVLALAASYQSGQASDPLDLSLGFDHDSPAFIDNASLSLGPVGVSEALVSPALASIASATAEEPSLLDPVCACGAPLGEVLVEDVAPPMR